ncbi:MAG TPA: acylphosphatase [candidate division Zixibacteria bacterium]|nr:acylphosphatase [candidate division Zixibacteria bacterium]
MTGSQRLVARVFGRVQGVGFRWWVRTRAEELGLVGWVANDPDERTVSLVAEGPPELLDRLEAMLWQGPPSARVERVETDRHPASGEFAGFQIARP